MEWNEWMERNIWMEIDGIYGWNIWNGCMELMELIELMEWIDGMSGWING